MAHQFREESWTDDRDLVTDLIRMGNTRFVFLGVRSIYADLFVVAHWFILGLQYFHWNTSHRDWTLEKSQYSRFVYNAFTGTLPTEIGLLTRLYGPILKNNTFNGTLPTEIGLLTSLDFLGLSSNTFSGTLPTEIGLLTRLYGLILKNNRFTGTLPTEIGLLTSLRGLGLSNNSFTGSVPLDFGTI